jgi:tight adherence protein C
VRSSNSLRRFGLHFAALLTLLAFASPARAEDSLLEVVEVRTDSFPRIVVRVNAMLDDSAPLAQLSPEQLRVVDDGQPQTAIDLYQIRTPATAASVVLAIDVSGSMGEQERLPQARQAAREFIAMMRPQDRTALMSFANEVMVRQPLSSDRRMLTRAADSLTAGGNTRLYDALARSIETAGLAGGTRAVVVLSDGEDTTSASPVEDGIGRAVNAGVPVYTVGLGSEVQHEVLQRIALETGGRFYHAPRAQDLAQVFRLISRQLSSQYEVYWFSRVQGEAGREVPVQMKLNAPGGMGAEARFTYRLPQFARAPSLPDNDGPALAVIVGPAPPSQDQALLAGLLAALAVAVAYAGFLVRSADRVRQLRLARYVGGLWDLGFGSASLSSRRVSLMPLTAASAGLVGRLLPRAQVERLRRMLAQAGLRSERHFQIFLATLLALPIVLASTAYFLIYVRGAGQRPSTMILVAVGIVLPVMGFYLPYFWLRRRIQIRRRALLRALPDALDLMTIGVSAGLSFDGAMLELVQKWDNELSRELAMALNEMRMGASRREALLNLVERTQLEDIRLLVAAVIQADELGSSLAETLTIQAEQLRIRRRQRAEELARKAPVKMLIPLVFLIFPALFVVILGPAVPAVLNALKSIAGS